LENLDDKNIKRARENISDDINISAKEDWCSTFYEGLNHDLAKNVRNDHSKESKLN
jgi:hypothetical protein